MKFKVLFGGHANEVGEQFLPGDIVDTNTPLDKMFPGKFEIVTASEEKKEKAEEKTEAPKNKEGEDVTDSFEIPEELQGVKVLKFGGWYAIIDTDGEELTEDRMRKKDVQEALEALVEEEEE